MKKLATFSLLSAAVIFLVTCLFSTLLLSGCKDTGVTGAQPVHVDNYIRGFIDCNDIIIQERIDFRIDEESKKILSFGNPIDYDDMSNPAHDITNKIIVIIDLEGKFYSENTKTKYNELLNEIGDTSFDATIANIDLGQRPVVVTDMINVVSVTVDQDYNGSCSAGSDAASLFTLVYEDPYSVIKNNYKSPTETYRIFYCPQSLPKAWYKTDFAPDVLPGKKALGRRFILWLTESPAVTGDYTFTITVDMGEDKIFTATTKPIKIKGL